MTIPTLKALVYLHGEDLTWAHFEPFYGMEVGSGLYIMSYPIDSDYGVLVGGDGVTTPYYVYLVSRQNRNNYIDVRTNRIDQFLSDTQTTHRVPEGFSFALTWGIDGISSYDSRTGTLVKNVHLSKTEDYVTHYTLSEEARQQIYQLLMDLHMDEYPDTYNPGNGLSEPSMTLVLSAHFIGRDKTIRAEDIASFSFGYASCDERGVRFLETCQAIINFLESTNEWQAMPPYAPYE